MGKKGKKKKKKESSSEEDSSSEESSDDDSDDSDSDSDDESGSGSDDGKGGGEDGEGGSLSATEIRDKLLEYVAHKDALDVRAACKGWGTNEKSLINIICARTKSQIARITALYEPEFGMTLRAQIKKECSGDFGKLLRYSLEERHKMDAELLYKAMKGMGTTEEVLTEIICLRSNEELTLVKTEFETRYQKPLEAWVGEEIGSFWKPDYKNLLVQMMKCERDESDEVDESLAKDQADKLYKGGVGYMMTIHHTPYTIHHTPYTIHHPPSTIHHTPYTIHHTPSTIHHTPYTIHHPLIHHLIIRIISYASSQVHDGHRRRAFHEYFREDERGADGADPTGVPRQPQRVVGKSR
jgi:hypothetical protein